MTRELLQAAGRRLREDVDVSEGASSAYALARRALVEKAADERTARRRRYGALRASALCAAAVLMLWVGYGGFEAWQRRGLAFVAGEAAQPGRVGAYYGANAGAPLGLRFEDGSRIRVEPSGGLRVADLDTESVAVQLETGSAQFDIVPGGGKTWEVFAGPYRVRVTGTSFLLSWNVPEQALELQMRSGAVVLSGPGIESGQRVSGSERFVSRVTSSRSALPVASTAPSTKVEPSAPVHGPAPFAESVAPAPAVAGSKAETTSKSEPTTSKSEPTTSKSEPISKRQAEPARALEANATEQVVAAGSSEQLLALADAARFSGQVSLAERALKTVRERFAGSPGAASAAFLLGKMAEDAGNLGRAVSYYDAHVRESGQLVPEAAGRKMLVLYRLGKIQGARDAAREYLERSPEGPYARQARELLSR